jgi:plasmid stabilization system protein ParE
MKVVLSPEAVERLRARVFPRTGRSLKDRDLWEIWIPRTRLMLWYRIEHERILIVTVWHTSQNRSAAKP